MNERDVLKLLKVAIKEAGTQADYAKHIGVSPQFLSDVLKRRRGISEAIEKALGIEPGWDWIKKK